MTSPVGIPTTSDPVRFAVWLDGVGWLVDTCAGGTTSTRIADAVLFDSADEARAAMATLGYSPHEPYESPYIVVSL